MRFRFIARGEDGGQKTGFLEAADEQGAQQQLQRRRLQVVRLEPDQGPAPPRASAPPPPPPPRPSGPIKTEPTVPSRPIRENSLLSMLDLPKLGAALVGLGLLAGGGLYFWSRPKGEKDVHLHLSGRLSLVSRQDLGSDYLERIQVGLRLKSPEWQINRDGSIEERAEDGKFHRGQRHAKVQFQMGDEGDYTMDVQTSLPASPDQVTFFVEAPGFPAKQKEVKLDANLQGQVKQIALHRLKKRETRDALAPDQTAPVAAPASNVPKYDPEGPEADE